jgi:nucleotide-binding universal stress UspA family protein
MNHPLVSRVLVPLDGSPAAEVILPHLRRLLYPHESSLTLLQALPSGQELQKEEATHYLRTKACELTNEGFPAKYALRYGPATSAILDVVSWDQITLIALATHGRSGIQRWVMGSVAEEILQSSPVPVLLVRSLPSPSSMKKPEASPLRSVLLPLDGSAQALDVLDPVIALARSMDARVRILQVADPTPVPGQWDLPEESAKKADRVLREACIPTTFELRRGNPAEEILKSVEEHSVDLIAMTTHGRSGPPRWVIGSVTAEVLRHSTVPLLVVRHQDSGPAPKAAHSRSSMEKAARPGDIPAASAKPD